jgi:hypothetical protein
MLAWAIWKGTYDTIGMWGVDMALDGVTGESEYSHQRPSVEYWLGIAQGRGIKLVLPTESEILKCGPYRRKLIDRSEQLAAQEQQLMDTYEQTKRELFTTEGGLRVLDLLESFTPKDPDLKATLQKEYAALSNTLESVKRDLHHCRGAKHDNAWNLSNYMPGDGPVQEIHRTDRSIVLDDVQPTVAQSDGRNRIAALVREG